MARISRLRGVQSLRRRPGNRAPRSIFLIVCEGETEKAYFDALRSHYGLSRAEVVIAENDEGSAPISVVVCAENKAREAGGYDRIFCVFDRDEHESFARARDRIAALAKRKQRSLPISEAVSIPCFEFWLLLHFEQTDAAFADCAAVIRRLREADKLPGYVKIDARKADAGVTQALMARLEQALANADWLAARAEANDWNPYTSAQTVVRALAKVKEEGRADEH